MEQAVNRHFEERNEFYLKNLKRVGHKIWDKELFDTDKHHPWRTFQKNVAHIVNMVVDYINIAKIAFIPTLPLQLSRAATDALTCLIGRVSITLL